MEKVINLIYDIEEKANYIIKRASEEKVQLYESLQKDIDLLDKTIEAENAEKLHALKIKTDEDLSKELSLINKECDKQLSYLEQYFTKNYSSLIDKIFKNIIET